jgi:hypothetical protein
MKTGFSHLFAREIYTIQGWSIPLSDASSGVLAVLFLVRLAAGGVPENVLTHNPEAG